jgi:hypothetical protein
MDPLDPLDPLLLGCQSSDVFTPDEISKRMAQELHQSGSLLEPAVGTGQLLVHLDLRKYDPIDVYDIKEKYLDGLKDLPVTKHHLDFLKTDASRRYQNIILNPPFIRWQDLSHDYRAFIKGKWPILSKGNVDLYYAFLVKGLEHLTDDGVMVAITPNSYLYNKSARALRQYFISNRLVKEIIDYRSEKVFPGVSTYCCITVFTKCQKDSFVYNTRRISYQAIPPDSFLGEERDDERNEKNEKKCLGDICTIKNGIATLRDKIYIHPTKRYDEPCWKQIITSLNQMWVIYPYDNGVIIGEETFKKDNPQTYAYLLTQKEELAKRDKGAKAYPKWYAYGRSQSLVIPKSERVIYVPTFCDPSRMEYKISPPTLWSGCLCVDVTDETYDVEEIAEHILSKHDYLERQCSKRGGGWITLTSTVLKTIPI